jgi:hypothetical protein
VETTKVEVGQLFGALAEQVRRNIATTLIAVAILVAGNLALDRLGETSSLAPSGFLSLGVQLYVTRAALGRAGLLTQGAKARLWSFWGMSIVTSIAILAGCVLLLIPGLYLAARWFLAGPAIIAEDLSAGEGMRESAELTRSSIWHIGGALLLLYGCGFGAGLVPLTFYPDNGAPIVVQAFSYVCIFATSISAWLMAVGAYAMLSHRGQRLAEVFA